MKIFSWSQKDTQRYLKRFWMIQLRILTRSQQILGTFSKVFNIPAGICKDLHLLVRVLTHWLLERFGKNAFLDILVVLRQDLGQISFNVVENAFATRQLALLATRIAFYNVLARACAEIIFFSIFDFFSLSFFSVSFVFAAVIDLLLGLLAVKKLLSKSHRGGQFLLWNS